MPRLPIRASTASGFTLVELLVVIVIVGITLTLVVVNFARDDKRVLSDEAQRLGLLLEHAHDEAVASSRLLSLTADGAGYRFTVASGAGQWLPLEGDDVFRPRAWAGGVNFGGLRVLQNASPSTAAPRLMFSPSGFNAPFEFTLAAGDSYAVVGGDALGRVAISMAETGASAYRFAK